MKCYVHIGCWHLIKHIPANIELDVQVFTALGKMSITCRKQKNFYCLLWLIYLASALQAIRSYFVWVRCDVIRQTAYNLDLRIALKLIHSLLGRKQKFLRFYLYSYTVHDMAVPLCTFFSYKLYVSYCKQCLLYVSAMIVPTFSHKDSYCSEELSSACYETIWNVHYTWLYILRTIIVHGIPTKYVT